MATRMEQLISLEDELESANTVIIELEAELAEAEKVYDTLVGRITTLESDDDDDRMERS